MLIRKGSKILLARSPNFPPDMYSLIAGFVEPGRSAEAAVEREIWEEVGIKVKKCNLLRDTGMQRFPKFPVIGFTAEYDSGEIRPGGFEIEDAK